MAEYSFDVVSRVDLTELRNAVDQTMREIANRFDFKNSVSEVTLDREVLRLHSDDEFRLKQLTDVLESKLVKRGVSLKALDRGRVEPAARGTVRQEIRLRQGLDSDTGRLVVKRIKDSGRKVNAQLQGDQVRVTGKSKDELQAVMQLLREADLPLDLQFVNYR